MALQDRLSGAGLKPVQAAAVKSRRWCCVKKTQKRRAVQKMKEGPSEPPCRGRLQTALSCFGPKTAVVNVRVKRRDVSRQVWIKEMSASKPSMQRRNAFDDVKTRGSLLLWDQHRGHLLTGYAASGV